MTTNKRPVLANSVFTLATGSSDAVQKLVGATQGRRPNALKISAPEITEDQRKEALDLLQQTGQPMAELILKALMTQIQREESPYATYLGKDLLTPQDLPKLCALIPGFRDPVTAREEDVPHSASVQDALRVDIRVVNKQANTAASMHGMNGIHWFTFARISGRQFGNILNALTNLRDGRVLPRGVEERGVSRVHASNLLHKIDKWKPSAPSPLTPRR